MQPRTSLKRMAGISLIEALVAAAILGFGGLALLKYQAYLVESSGYNRELQIAVHLANSKLNELRAFESQDDFDAKLLSGNENHQAGDTIVAYSIDWIVTDNGPEEIRPVAVNVSWEDMRGETQNVMLATVIQRFEPSLSSHTVQQVVRPGNPIRPYERGLTIPIEAEDQGDGTSVFQPPGADPDVQITFDNPTGDILDFDAGGGMNYLPNNTYYLLSGFLDVDSNVNNFMTNNNVTSQLPIEFLLLEINGNQPLNNYECWNDSHLEEQAFEGYITYTCIVLADNTNEFDQAVWSGRMRIVLDDSGADYGWRTSGGSNYKVCRHSHTYDPYEEIDRPLMNQNYAIQSANQGCPGGSEQFHP